MLNQLTLSLIEILRELPPIYEKHLIAPSIRIGNQWLEAIARSDKPVINVKVGTLRHLAMDIALPKMESLGLSYLGNIGTELIVNHIFENLRKKGENYLTGITPSYGFILSLSNSIRTLRLAGIRSDNISADDFEVGAKGKELKILLRSYEEELQRLNLIDFPQVFQIAAAELKKEYPVSKGNYVIIIPDNMEKQLRGVELTFWNAIPPSIRKIIIKTKDEPKHREGLKDISLLRWLSSPRDAPPPNLDETVEIYRCIGEVNEVRKVLRICLARDIAFDEVEILYTDSDTYLPLIYETVSRLNYDLDNDIPITFAQGIPIKYFRPGKALIGWLEWIQTDYPQAIIELMIKDGLLCFDETIIEEIGFSKLAAIFRGIPIGAMKNRYLQFIDREIRALDEYFDLIGSAEENRNNSKAIDEKRQRLKAVKSIRKVIERLLSSIPEPNSSPKDILNGAVDFLNNIFHPQNKWDDYYRGTLVDEINTALGYFEDIHYEDFDSLRWLSNLTYSISIGGKGPYPGAIYAAPILQGGHSGRRYTFILGMDERRFPWFGRSDPILLDRERGNISGEIPTSSSIQKRKGLEFSELLSRLQGEVVFTYSCRDLTDDRDIFPSPLLLSIYRIISGEQEGTLSDFLKWLPDPISFAPRDADESLDISEWWLSKSFNEGKVFNGEEIIFGLYPHLKQGAAAKGERESNRFTEYDGFIPEAGEDYNPSKPDTSPLSASRLETLGRCPFEYFLRYILKIEPLIEYEFDPAIWLDALKKGELLHSTFKDFMTALNGSGKLPSVKRDGKLLFSILNEHISLWRKAVPPPNEEVFRREYEDIKRAAWIFLAEEERYFSKAPRKIPLYFELSVGMGEQHSRLKANTSSAIKIKLPSGRSLYARGRFDRVDKIIDAENESYIIWDYKTGSAYKYKNNKSISNGGRVIQNILYYFMAKRLFPQINPHSQIESFGYFFPNSREHGERIVWGARQLEDGSPVLENLTEMLSKGCFPFSDNADDVKFSDYQLIYGDIENASSLIIDKMDNKENDALKPFIDLREQ